jgi:flagellar basal-body rod modification protein FlgD
MPVSPISATTPSQTFTGAVPASAPAPNDSVSGTWMKMLLAQVRNPNPFADSDPTATVTQMAQFQMVSEIHELSNLLKAQAQNSSVNTGSGLLGKSVAYLDADGNEQTGVATGLRVTTGGVKLQIGRDEVALSQVRTVTAAAS